MEAWGAGTISSGSPRPDRCTKYAERERSDDPLSRLDIKTPDRAQMVVEQLYHHLGPVGGLDV